jgi:hypothetical protein
MKDRIDYLNDLMVHQAQSDNMIQAEAVFWYPTPNLLHFNVSDTSLYPGFSIAFDVWS